MKTPTDEELFNVSAPVTPIKQAYRALRLANDLAESEELAALTETVRKAAIYDTGRESRIEYQRKAAADAFRRSKNALLECEELRTELRSAKSRAIHATVCLLGVLVTHAAVFVAGLL